MHLIHGMNTFDTFRLIGKTSLVIGGARDLGYDMADVLAEAGSNVIITSRQASDAEAAAKKLAAERGVQAVGLALDARNYAAVEAVCARAHSLKGGIDILVNNLGGTPGSGKNRLFERSAEDIAELINVNLVGALFCCKAAAKLMVERKQGKIINIASVAALVGRDRRMYDKCAMSGQPIDYAAAKAGIIGMTRDLAAYLGPFGINVNSISPGGFARGQPGSFEQDYADRTPLGRMGRDGVDLKGAALFLASPASDYVTGHNLVVDGGFSIWQ